MLSLLLALTAPIPAADPILVTASALHAERAPVRLHLNGGDYRPGDRVRVEVETSEDGYLVVFRVDADGLVRVLFPLDPDLDAYVRGGKRYELRGRGDRETFLADDAGGTGLIYAALSREPMDLRRYATGSHWDYNELKLQSDDPEAELSWFVRQFTSNGLFEYDVLGYRVYGPGFEEATPVVVTGGGGYYDPYYYGSSYGYGYPRTGLNISIGAQFGRPYYYDPYYDPWYGFGYGYNSYGYGGYGYRFGGFGYYPYRHISVFPTPTHGVVSNPIYGVRSRPRAPLAGVGSFADGVGGVNTVASGGRNAGINRNTGGGGGSRGEFTTGSRPRTPQGEVQRPQSQSGGQDPRRVGGTTTGTAGRSAPAPAARPTTPAPADRGERSRRPTSSAGQPASPAPTITQRRTDERSLSPAATDRPAARPTSERRAAERPVYRPPTSSTSGSDGARPSGDRPAASSRPRQVDRPAPSTGRSADRPAASPRSEPASRSPRPSVDRERSGSVDRGSRSSPAVRSAPATRSAPEARSAPSDRSAPAARSAPSSSSRGSSGGGGRSRGRGSSD